MFSSMTTPTPAASIKDIPAVANLNNLSVTVPTSLLSLYSSHCWRSLFIERTDGWDIPWLSISRIRSLAQYFVLDRSALFLVYFWQPGFIHLVVHRNGIWSVQDILLLPDWILVGGTFMKHAIADGYSKEFILGWCKYRDNFIYNTDGI